MRKLFVGVVIIGSFGGYFLLNPKESQTDSVLVFSVEGEGVEQKKMLEFLPLNRQIQNVPQAIASRHQEKESKHIFDIDYIVSNPMASKDIILKNINEIAKCSSCLELLKATMLTAKLSREEFSELASNLTSGNHPEIAKMLLSTVAQMMAESRNTEGADAVIQELMRFDSPEVAEVFARSLILDGFNNGNVINGALESTLQETINLMAERQAIGSSLAKLYLNADNASQREKLLAIQQPESLVEIFLFLSKQGDNRNAESILIQLQNNPSPYTASALLKLAQSDSFYSNQSSNVIKLATSWAEQYAKNDAVDLMENTLITSRLSSSEENLMITMLQHSSDERAQVMVSKYMSYKDQKN